MIPLCSREKILHEVDGIAWQFKPRIGLLENEVSQIFSDWEKLTIPEQYEKTDAMINKVLVGWSGGNMPKFPEDGNLAALFSQEEKIDLLIMWKDANTLKAEEKKS
jgi:hypothetical protein